MTDDTTLAAPPRKSTGNGERSGIQSLVRAFSILEEIAQNADGVALASLSKAVGLHNSTAFHLVKTMVSLGYIRQNPETKRYHLGRMVFSLAANSRSEIDLLGVAEPIVKDLANGSGETTHLAIFSGNEVMIVAKTAGSSAFELRERHGGGRPGHATALGKVLLAACSRSQVDAYIEAHGLPAFTQRTIVDADRLHRELETVRTAGIAFDDGEFDAEVRCLAVPVYDFTGDVAAAIGVSGPVWRVSLQQLEGMKDLVRRAAVRLSEELGGAEHRKKG